MRTTKQLSSTHPTAMAEALTERVTAGDYASESEVIRHGLRALFARDEAVETWLRSEVTASYDELRADPTRAISSADLRAPPVRAAHPTGHGTPGVTRRVVYSRRAQHQLTELYIYITEQSGFPDRAHDFTTAIINPATDSPLHRCSVETKTICDPGCEPSATAFASSSRSRCTRTPSRSTASSTVARTTKTDLADRYTWPAGGPPANTSTPHRP